jgi:hypothetical protein
LENDHVKITIACTLGAALSFLGTLGFAQDASPPHQSFGPEHNWHEYRNESQGSDELDETGLAKEIDEENRRLDRIDNICRGAEGRT